jgi:hypothetical protein
MTNRFGVDLHPKEVRWAAAEGVSEDVIAAVLLLHERSVDEIAPRLSAPELEQVINLVDRNPRLYPPGIDIRNKPDADQMRQAMSVGSQCSVRAPLRASQRFGWASV